MDTATLDDFMALNDQLAALVRAGVPLDVVSETSEPDLATALEKINALVVRRVGRGESLTQALEDDERAVPTWYRCLVEVGSRSGKFDAALDGSNRVAASVDSSRHAVRAAFFYPLVVCFLAYLGMIGFCLFLVPTLESMSQSIQIAPGPGLRILLAIRDTLPYWIAIPPIALMLVGLQIYLRSHRSLSDNHAGWILSCLPGTSRTIFLHRGANFAETLAILLDSGVPMQEGLPLAGGACGDVNLADDARALSAMLQTEQVPDDDAIAAMHFPPFLRWALLHSEETIGRVRALQMVASVYRESAERHAERLKIAAPLATCVILSGGVTLLYGLALFVPVVEMLRALVS